MMPRQASRRRNHDKTMSLGSHLRELRRRLFLAAAAVLVASIVGWFFSNVVVAEMQAPLVQIAKSHEGMTSLNFDNVSAAFDLRIQIAITVGLVLSSPIWLYQVWAYFVPALTRKELKYSLGFFFSAVPLFLAGCTAGWLLVPRIVTLLTSFAPYGTATLLSASTYFTFVLKLVVAVGIAFVLPVFLVLLNFVGVLSGKSISKAWRVALIIILCFAAAVTPSADVISMLLLAAPMAVLYFAAVGIALIHDRSRARATRQLSRAYAIEERGSNVRHFN
jgi:sec-independent protein translocase protein TatC